MQVSSKVERKVSVTIVLDEAEAKALAEALNARGVLLRLASLIEDELESCDD